MDQFFTPPEYTLLMLEKMDCDSFENKTILDPSCGSGNLLMACLIAGANIANLYGNDYDKDMVILCRSRLKEYALRKLNQSIEDSLLEINIHQGNVLQKMCIKDFSDSYNKNYLKEGIEKFPSLLDDLRFA